MTKQGLPVLLILMMLITPIASAFEHCAGMDMSGHLSESHHLSDTLPAKDAIPLDHKKIVKGSQNNQTDMDCHNSSSCTVHICGGYGIMTSVSAINIVATSSYLIYQYASPYDTLLLPDLRPPKLIL